MNKKHQSKLEDIEYEVDSIKEDRKQKIYYKKINKVLANYDAEWDNIEVPTTKDLGIEYRQSYYKWIGIPIAILFGVIIGVLLLA